MIIKEFYHTRRDGVTLYRNYSDQGMKIHKIGTEEIYDEAIDVENVTFEYEETNIPVDVEEEEVPDEEALQILMGGIEE